MPNIFNIKNSDIKEDLNNYLDNPKSYTLEIGCGHGDYSVELALKNPQRNFIGIDVKGARIYKGARRALDFNLNNVAFIVSKAEWLGEIFQPKSIEEIYIPFPEPHVKRANHNRRLLSPSLLKLYKHLLSDSGLVHFKTDNEGLCAFAVKSIFSSGGKILNQTDDLYSNYDIKYQQNIVTSFEKYYVDQRKQIKYICFRF